MRFPAPRRLRRIAAAAGVAAAAGCSRGPQPLDTDGGFSVAPAVGEFSLATYNLRRYTFDDRDGDGQRNNPKPDAEREAAADLLARIAADVLAIQEIGPAAILDGLVDDLRRRGLDYPHRDHILRPGADTGLAVLSRFPIVERTARMDDLYRIGSTNLPVQRGFLDVIVEPAPGYRFRLLAAHLKSKTYHPLGQTEMRRNEARLLANHVRRALREASPLNLAVVGDFGDGPGSAPLKELLGEGDTRLIDLRPTDLAGDAWTHHGAGDDVYSRVDYILVSPGMELEWAGSKARVVRAPPATVASDHRPLVAVFRAAESPAPPPPSAPDDAPDAPPPP